ncbi:MAG: DUF1304 domain-containing protein [Proteobacteria bacterium]|nr:DUF1304 domain-containing protein [Pseudomonadota bacterium]
MRTASRIVVGLIAALHIYILVLEMVLWNTPRGHDAFDLTPEFAESTRVLAANQGLYNGFLAAGMIWGLLLRDPRFARHVQLFFLGCVAVAGIFGAATAKMSILFIQTVPASFGLALVLLAGRGGRAREK